MNRSTTPRAHDRTRLLLDARATAYGDDHPASRSCVRRSVMSAGLIGSEYALQGRNRFFMVRDLVEDRLRIVPDP